MKDYAGTILADAATKRDVTRTLLRYTRLRAEAQRLGLGDHHTRVCPVCGCGVHLRTTDHSMYETLMICPRCNWYKVFPFQMNEARDFTEEFVPRKGDIVVQVGLGGHDIKVKRV